MPDMEKEIKKQQEAEEEKLQDVPKEEAEADLEEAAVETAGEETNSKAEDGAKAREDASDKSSKEEQNAEETAEADGTAKEDGKKLFGKKEKKKDKTQEKIEELEDRVKRQLAEFENFRNRSEKEKTAMFETGAKSVIEKMLPIIDNFERGLMTVPEDEKDSPFVDGMNKIYKQMVTELEAIGVKPIEAVGLEFDPNLHNAVMQVESEEYESGVVAQELQKGYLYHDTVVRHSMVAVVQ